MVLPRLVLQQKRRLRDYILVPIAAARTGAAAPGWKIRKLTRYPIVASRFLAGVGGKKALSKARLAVESAGRCAVYRSDVPRPPLDILFADDRYVAVNKPSGVASIPGRGDIDSVLSLLAAKLALPAVGSVDPRIRVVHRLDKETSGVLLFAKDVEAQRHISHQFQNNQTEKEYLALVGGRPTESQGTIDAALARHPTSPQRMAVVRHGGRNAKTDWQIESQFRDYTLLRVFPRTGKTHQIRVHLRHIGLPLAIDPLYNTPSAGIFLSRFKRGYRPSGSEAERPLIDRLTLHAEKLTFVHVDGRTIQIIAPLPRDFRAALNMLAKHGRG